MRILIVEDSEDDALLLIQRLKKEGLEFEHLRVDTPEAFTESLRSGGWDAVLADYNLPAFSAPAALAILREMDPDVPFIVVSGTIGEETAVEMIRAGANDYVLKGNLTRLGPAIRREIAGARHRRSERAAIVDLERSERKFRSLFAQASELIALIDSSGGFIDVNPVALETFGYAADELWIMRYADVLVEDEKAPTDLLGLPAGGVARSIQTFRRRDGSCFYGEVSSRTLADASVLLIIRDITERVKAQRELEESSRQQRALAELGTLAISSSNLAEVFRVACAAAVDALEGECAVVVKLDDAGECGHVVASYGFNYTGCLAEPFGRFFGAQTAGPDDVAIVFDWDDEFVAKRPRLFEEHGCRSAISVTIPGRGQRWGAFGVQSTAQSRFGVQNATFLRAIANLLGDAIERYRAEEALRNSRAVLARAQRIAQVANWTWDFASDTLE